MTVYLVRHARAGSRQRWKKDDALRPLSKVGRVQAAGITRSMARRKVECVVTSPYLRCRETVDAIAAKRHLTIATSDELAEGAPLSEALRAFEKVIDQETVLCTHGDIVRDLLDHFARARPEAARPPTGEGLDLGPRGHRRRGDQRSLPPTAQDPLSYPVASAMIAIAVTASQMKPSTNPAVAISRPVCAPFDVSICRRAM